MLTACGGKVVVDAPSGQGGAGTTGQGGAGQGGAGQGGSGGTITTGCVSAAACDDQNACTADSCNVGQCGHALVSADDGNACTIDICNPAMGVNHTPLAVDDGNLCTSDGCDPPTGPFHVPLNPDDGNACTVDSCDPAKGVQHLPVSCEDGNLCTLDSCDVAAGCLHGAVSVDDGNACTVDGCDPAQGVSHAPLDCNDGNPCTIDLCNPQSGCLHQAAGALFSEHFDDNSAGWLLEGGWGIGPAKVSTGQLGGFGTDPANDHTTGQLGGGIAGAFIGGNVPPDIVPPAYLTSPVINLAGLAGPVTLEFHRVLNCDYPPFMSSTVEVHDGTKWVTKFAVQTGMMISENTSPGMSTWTKVQYDVSAEAAGNAAFRLRWSYAVLMGGVFTVGSWNIDDVSVISGQVCP